jgi:hypothetical protein
MGKLTAKALKWIGNFGTRTEQVAATGLRQPDLTKMLSKNRKSPPRITLDHLETIAKRRLLEASQVLQEIEAVDLPEARVPRHGTLSVVDQARIAWEELFENDPLRGKRVLTNLQHQEALGYTDLVSNIVRAIIDNGPSDAIPLVTKLLHDATKETRETPKTAKLRAEMAREYKRIR